jgi:hypothetical protein
VIELLKAVISVSHFQVALFAAEVPNAYPDNMQGDTLASFSSNGVAVSTAWDENGTVAPHVAVTVYLYEEAVDLQGLQALAQAPIGIGSPGFIVGNAISGDLHSFVLKEGRYDLLVAADTREPFKARRVGFFLKPLK